MTHLKNPLIEFLIQNFFYNCKKLLEHCLKKHRKKYYFCIWNNFSELIDISKMNNLATIQNNNNIKNPLISIILFDYIWYIDYFWY